MSLSYLLMQPTAQTLPSWQFEHAMSHRLLMGAMSEAPTITEFPITGGPGRRFHVGGGFQRFSALPYLIDPQQNVGMWHLNHNQAHSDFQRALPGYFAFTTTGTLSPTFPGFTSMDFADPGLLGWWTFVNHQEHLTAQTVLPLELNYPFW